MIFGEHKQGTDGWLLERSRIPTGSKFDKILTSTGKKSEQSKAYMNQLLAEYYTGGPVDEFKSTRWMEQGNELEPEARETYSFITGRKVIESNLCFLNKDRLVGASPDGFVDTDGLLEIKCPKAATLVGYMLSGGLPAKYKPQVQGQMWVTGRKWCDFMVYHPQLEPFIVRVERDEEYIKLLSDEINKFNALMLEKRGQLNKLREI